MWRGLAWGGGRAGGAWRGEMGVGWGMSVDLAERLDALVVWREVLPLHRRLRMTPRLRIRSQRQLAYPKQDRPGRRLKVVIALWKSLPYVVLVTGA